MTATLSDASLAAFLRANPDLKQKLDRADCEESHLDFTTRFFAEREGSPFLVGPHHRVMCEALDRVLSGEIKRLIINIPPGYTKCCHRDTLVAMKGGYRKIGAVKVGDQVVSFDSGRRVLRAVKGVETFRKDCVTVRTRSGRSTKASYDHPVLTQRGWVQAGQLTADHYLVRMCAEVEGESPLDPAELDFLTLMLFEGGCSGRTLRFTSADPEVVALFKASADALGFSVKQYACNAAIDYNVMGGVDGGAARLIVKHGLDCLAKDKRLPGAFFDLPLAQKHRFLSLMFATDGFVIARTGQLGIALASKGLVQDISLLLDSCGIQNSVYDRENGHAGEFRLIIGTQTAQRLAGKVDLLHKQAAFLRALEMPSNPSLVFGYPYDVMKGLTYLCRNTVPRIGIKRAGSMITSDKFEKLARVAPELERYRMRDFIYDRVASVEAVGFDEVVHLSVDADAYDDKNYVADGYVVHNTELAVIYLASRGLAINPRAKFIHASFNGVLALENSSKVRDVLRLPGYQALWPRKIRIDTDGKGLWRTVEGGGMMAAAAGGPITGFRAGTLEPGFTGALIIDDPLKPDDANSELERNKINERWHSTFKSRLAHEDVPVVIIMQRLHVDDLSGYLLKGGAGCQWHHLLMPIEVDSARPYPAEYTHGIPIEHRLADGPLWPVKHNAAQIEILKCNPYVFSGQYAQEPVVAGGNMFHDEWLIGYDSLPPMAYRTIYVDTAQKTGQRNDYSVFQCWGMGRDGRAYLIDQARGKLEAPELERLARAFWAKHRDVFGDRFGPLRAMKIEDKASGTGLIQSLRRPPDPIIIVAIPRSRDKEERANDVMPILAAGLVCVPTDAPWFPDFRAEFLAFPHGAHDDQVDPMMDAVSDMLGGRPTTQLHFG